jgi:hypothetical protein
MTPRSGLPIRQHDTSSDRAPLARMLLSVIGSKAARPIARADASLGDHTITGRRNWRFLLPSRRLLLGAGPENHPRRNNSEHGNQKQRRDRASHATPPLHKPRMVPSQARRANQTPLAVTPLQSVSDLLNRVDRLAAAAAAGICTGLPESATGSGDRCATTYISSRSSKPPACAFVHGPSLGRSLDFSLDICGLPREKLPDFWPDWPQPTSAERPSFFQGLLMAYSFPHGVDGVSSPGSWAPTRSAASLRARRPRQSRGGSGPFSSPRAKPDRIQRNARGPAVPAGVLHKF